jgi:hypothetical protein
MRSQLDAMTPIERVVATGEWTAEITQTTLPDLAGRRREAILEAVETDDDMDVYTLAEMVGGRGGTFARLAGEARTARKRRNKAAAPSE